MAKESVTNAVKDAGISFKDFEQAFVGYVYGRIPMHSNIMTNIILSLTQMLNHKKRNAR